MSSPLRVRPHAPDADGTVLQVTPESAGWTYVGFRVLNLAAGESYAGLEVGREACLVVLTGRIAVDAAGKLASSPSRSRSVIEILTDA